MAHIVEAPRGHLSGAIVVTTIDTAGTALNVSSYNVSGSIASQNVSVCALHAQASRILNAVTRLEEVAVSRAPHDLIQ